MASKSARSADFKISGVRVLYAQSLFEARAAEEGGAKKHTPTLLIPKSAEQTIKLLKETCGKVALEQWGDKAKNMIANGVLKDPILDGDGPQGVSKQTGERKEGHAGHFFIRPSATEKYPPRVYITRNGQIVPASKDEVYSGCFGDAVINVFSWQNDKQGPGLSFGISMFFFTRHGERLGGGGAADPNKFFEAVPDEGVGAVDAGDQGAASLFG